MSTNRPDPYPAFNFTVTIGTVLKEAGFSECTGLVMESDPIEYRNGNEPGKTVRKIYGLNKYGNITLKRGFTPDLELFKWRKDAMDGKDVRMDDTIVLGDELGEGRLVWTFTRGWPRKLEGPAMNAKNNEIAIETLELVVESLRLELA